ncbi:hypothetical protein KSW81_007961 [Nannochloris sp. 'desiccata']|nr:hypothetical protein KSW81_007961 [Chlorella desiccata (nom. nud.)]
MGLNDLKNLDLNTLIGCKLTAQEAFVFLADLQTMLSDALPQDLSQLWRTISKYVLRPDYPFELHQLLFKTTYLGWNTEANGPAPVWIPTQQGAVSTNAGRFMNTLELKAPSAWNSQQYRPSGDPRADWPLLYRLSIDHPEMFWPLVLEEFRFKFHTPPKKILENCTDDPDAVQWLPGARFNIAECALTGHDPDRPAILWAAEDSPTTVHTITRGELAQQAQHFANSLHAWDLKPGDAVGLDMPMVPQAVAAYLGIILAGCVVVSIADSFAPKEIESRLRIANAKAIITHDVVLRGGKVLPLYARVVEAGAPRAVVLPAGGGGGHQAQNKIRGELRSGDISWDTFLSFAPVPNTLHPYISAADSNSTISNILFSSGTTGEPKAIPWTHVTPLRCATDAFFHQDVRVEDVVCWPSSMGWMMGAWLVMSCLLNGAAMALFTGSPVDRQFGQFVSSARVAVLGLVPSIVRSWKASGCMRGIDFSCIRCFSSTGEASAAEEYLWLSSLAGYCPVIEYCGGTEIGGGFLSGSMVQPQSPATFSTPTIGTRPVVLVPIESSEIRNGGGGGGSGAREIPIEPATGTTSALGELALIMPQLGVSQSLLNADHRRVYYEGMPRSMLRRHGDEVEKLSNGYCKAHGRVDDTMNLGGIKVSSVELERAVVEGVGEVAEAAAVAVPPADGGPDKLVLFLVLKSSEGDVSPRLTRACQHAISSRLNPLFKVGAVRVILALPRNASNKVMRRVLRDELALDSESDKEKISKRNSNPGLDKMVLRNQKTELWGGAEAAAIDVQFPSSPFASIRQALERHCATSGVTFDQLHTLEKVSLAACCPPLDKLDPNFGQTVGPQCKLLSLSTNNIDRLAGTSLTGLDKLEILSVGRNCLKRLDGLEAVSNTLQELWASYNALEKLAGVERCSHLRVLYASNNKIKDWAEVERLAGLEQLEDLLLSGNPLCGGDEAGYRAGVLRRLPQLNKLDGRLVSEEERVLAAAGSK